MTVVQNRFWQRIKQITVFSIYSTALVVSPLAPRLASADAPVPQIISVDADGNSHAQEANHTYISADGSIVAFDTQARLTASAINDSNAYVYDQRTHGFIWNTTYHSDVTGLSADGRQVLVRSTGDLSGDGHGSGLFLHDLSLNTTTRVSLDQNNNPFPNFYGDSEYAETALSANGRYVTFAALYDLTGETGQFHIWLRDLLTGTSQLIENGQTPSVSNDGHVIYQGGGSNPNQPFHIYNAQTGTTVDIPTNDQTDGYIQPYIAPDASTASFILTPIGASSAHVYLYNLATNVVTDLTPDANSINYAYGSYSNDGQHLTFSSSQQLAGDAPANRVNVYVYNIQDNTYTYVAPTSVTDDFQSSLGIAVSDNADVVAFTQFNSNRSNVYVSIFNSWTPPTATWTPETWDNTPPDYIPPVVTATFDPEMPASGWYNTPVTVSYTCTDPGHGVILPAPPSQTFSTDGEYNASSDCNDAAGNEALPNAWQVNIDTHPPQIHNVAVEADNPNGGTFDGNQMFYDDLSGTTPDTCDIANGTFLSVGDHTVTCTDTDVAGNTATGSAVFTVRPYHQPGLNFGNLGIRSKNVIANNKSVVTVTDTTRWGDTVMVAAATGSPDGTVKCKDSKGNSYHVVANKQATDGRLVLCAGDVINALVPGDKITITYPSFDGVSAVSASFARGLDTPGTKDDSSARMNIGINVTSGKATASNGPSVAFGAVGYTGNATFTPDPNYRLQQQAKGGSGSTRRTVVPVWTLNYAPGVATDYTLTGTLSKSASWQAVLTSWLATGSPLPA